MSGIEKITTAVNDMLQTALGVSLLDMFIQIAATIILVVIVKKYFWGKITAFLEKRGEILNQEFSQLETSKTNALELEQKRQAEYNELQRQKADLIAQAKRQADQEREVLLEAAKAEANRIKAENERQLEFEVIKAKEQLSKEVVYFAADMAKKMILQEVDSSKYTNDQFLDLTKGQSS